MKVRTLYLSGLCMLFSRATAFQDPSVLTNQKLFQYVDQLNEELGFEALQQFDFNDVMALVRQLGQLDRYNLSPADFLAHLSAATEVRDQFTFEENLSQEEFEKYLLPLRIRYESTARSSWRPFFKTLFLPMVEEKSIAEAADKILVFINRRISCAPETTYVLPYRGDLDPLTTWKGKHGDEIDVSILACAALRSVGIPARLVYTPHIRKTKGGKVWVEYMTEQKKWIPWVPTFSEKLATGDHLPALKVFLKNRGGVIFACPASPVEVTDQYAEIQTVKFTPSRNRSHKLEFNIAFEVNSILVPIRGYELTSISSTATDRIHASSDYWTFTVQDDLIVNGTRHHKK